MSISPTDLSQAHAGRVTVTDETLVVEFVDGRTLTVPLAWYPRLLHRSPAERAHWRLIANGEGVHWPDLDEDINVEGCSPDVAPARPRNVCGVGSTLEALTDNALCAGRRVHHREIQPGRTSR
jgi:hypothetical protein